MCGVVGGDRSGNTGIAEIVRLHDDGREPGDVVNRRVGVDRQIVDQIIKRRARE